MPRSLGFSIILAFSSCFLGACTPTTDVAKVSGSVQVRIPWPDAQGEIHPQDVSISGLQSLQEVRGDYARFVFAPKVTKSGLVGDAPHGRFLKMKNGVYVPMDEISQQLVLIYAHLEQLSRLDKASGVGGVLSWPRAVGVSTFLRDPSGKLWSDNFFYEADSDALLLVPTKDSVVPLAANAGVLGHEHFHSLFYRLVVAPLLREGRIAPTMTGTAHDEGQMQQILELEGGGPILLKSTPPEVQQWEKQRRTVFLKGLNEGLADVWGWIYSGNPDFVAASLPKFTAERTMKLQGEPSLSPLMSAADFSAYFHLRMTSAVDKEESLNKFSYQIGTQMARAVRGIFLGSAEERSAEGIEARRKLALRLMKSLPQITNLIRSTEIQNQSTKVLDLKSVLEVITSTSEMTKEQEKASLRWLGKTP